MAGGKKFIQHTFGIPPVAMLVIAAVVVVGVGVWAYFAYFAPEGQTARSDALSDPTARVVGRGSWSGADDFHYADGTVTLYESDNGAFLRFEDHHHRAGPDVYLYLTRDAGVATLESTERTGLRLLVPGGADGGEATVEGTFEVPIPAGTDLSLYHGLALWCDRFDAAFATATLQPVA